MFNRMGEYKRKVATIKPKTSDKVNTWKKWQLARIKLRTL